MLEARDGHIYRDYICKIKYFICYMWTDIYYKTILFTLQYWTAPDYGLVFDRYITQKVPLITGLMRELIGCKMVSKILVGHDE